MTFVHPLAWFLLALVVVPVLLYLLPMPRRRMTMPSLMLWQRMLRDRPTSQSWRWLRTLLSCLVQVLILVLLVLAVGKPVFGPAGAGGGEAAVIVLDVSASMKAPLAADAVDGRTRFDEARDVARRIVETLPSGQRAVLLAAGARPVVVCGPTDERALLLDRIDELACTDGRTDMKTALVTALELARGEGSAEVCVLSDGAADVSDVPLGEAKLRYFRIGETVGNVGIVDFEARRGLDFPDEYQALVRIRNIFDTHRSVELSLLMDGAEVEKRTVTVPAGATVEESFPRTLDADHTLKLNPRGGGVLEASLRTTDTFDVDDAAWALLGQPEKPVVVFASDVGDRFIRSALAENRAIDSYVPTMKKYLELRPPADVFIFKDQLPLELPAGNLLIVNPEKSSPVCEVEGEAQALTVADWDREHPVLAGITLKDVYVPAARVVKTPPWAEVLAEADGKPLILAGRESGRRVVVLTFDPGKSSLGFRVAFPVMLANAFAWLADRGDTSLCEVASGEDIHLKAPADLETLEVRGPDGLAAAEWYLYHHRIVV